MPIRSYLPIAIAIVSAAGMSILAASVAVDRIEASARAGLVQAMDAGGHDWASARVDGLQVILSGTAPDEAARFGAISAAGTVIDATRIIDRMTVRPAQTIVAPEYKVEILRNLDGISLIGLIPAGSSREVILDRLGRIASAPITDLLEEASYPAPEGWDDAVSYAIDALTRVPRSKVSITASRVAVTGIVDSEQVRRRIETELAGSVPNGLQLVLDINAPRPVIAPFTVRFVADETSRRFDACAAETQEARDRILAAARAAGADGALACQIGLGAPSLDWADAVALGIEAVNSLGAGTVTFSDANVSFVVPYTVEPASFDRQVGALERSLPEGFSLTAVRTQPPLAEGTTEVSDDAIPEFSAVLVEGEGVELTGRLPSERARVSVESYAHAHFGRDATVATTRLDDDLSQGWSLRVLAALDALSHLTSGTVTVRADTLVIGGETGREEAAAEIASLLAERLGQGAEFSINVKYIETLDPTLDIPTPEECVADLNAVLAVQKISFEPGSATVDGEGLKIIDQLAEILRGCQDVPMEIAGHTDSQGRESMNLNLSQERANAVLNSIMARRVLVSNLTAKGYGESVPVADNGTEEGREANRRIEFTLIEDASGEKDASKEESTEAVEGGTTETAEGDAAGEENEQN